MKTNQPMSGAERQRRAQEKRRLEGGERRVFNLPRDVNEGVLRSMVKHGDMTLTDAAVRLLRLAIEIDDRTPP